MGFKRPIHPDSDGDDSAISPGHNQPGLLGHEKDSPNTTRQILVDPVTGALLTVDGKSDDLLHSGEASAIADSTLTVISTYVAASAVKIYKIIVTGSNCADYELRKNLSRIGFKQTNIEMGVEFNFDNGLPLALNDTIDIRVEHFATGKTKDVKMFIYGE